MYVESHDRFADVGEFNPKLGRLEVYPRSDVTGTPPLGGHFSHLSGELCVLYRLEGALWLQVRENQWRLEEQGVSVDWTSLGEDLSELVVRDKGREIVCVRYQPTGRLYEDDVTPFVELEHFDFGLFVRNVLGDSGRRRRIYSEGL